MKSHRRLALALLIGASLGIPILSGPGHAYAEKETVSRPKIFSGFGAFSRKFTKLCEEMGKDGRRTKFRDIVAANDVKDLDCIACKPFFNSMKMMCSEKEPRGRKVEESAPGAKPQREPHMNVLTVASDIVEQLVSDQKRKEDIGLAVRKLAKGLRENTTLTPGEKDYFEVLASLFEGPFKASATHNPNNQPEAAHHFPQITADDLFED